MNTLSPEMDDMTTGPGEPDFGNFASGWLEEAEVEDMAESWDKYHSKGNSRVLYPICLGEVLHGRYLIEHKLGFGGGSTVWMAHDLHEVKDVALKVLSLGEWGENELRMQHEILQNVKDTSHIATILTTFLLPTDVKSIQHRVLVFPLLGPYCDFGKHQDIPMASRMSAARQLLEALKSLHEAGIIHRDLNDRNCMWGMAPLDHLDRSAKYEALGRPLKQTIPGPELWKKGELVTPVKIPEAFRTDDFYLNDFGIAKKDFCSPERIHGKDPSFACDMWSYMVVFSVLYLGIPPFYNAFEGGVMGDIVRQLGPLPEEWRGHFVDFEDEEGFPESWYDQSQTPDMNWNIPAKIARLRSDADQIEQDHVHSVMSRVFNYRPEERPTAAELLKDPSFRAIMDNYGC
ncbi:hypothetical protein N7451_000170 [Penicillium sp. IBT 35674x]|nr:hypothetical protein N7451_000170 [Penicillium sp. IBT 35674x]